MQLVDHFRTMARNNAWSNHRLLDACGRLTPEELRAPRSGFFPSVWLTLSHILLVDGYYLDALHGVLADPQMDEAVTPWTTFEELRETQRASDDRLIRFCDALEPARLSDEIVFDRGGGTLRRERLDRVSDTSVAPPQLDEFLLANDAPLRAADLAALGWKESAS
jgi:uncharacterized damage-inducible protein DinB